MKRARRQHTVLLALCLLTVPVVACLLWLRAQQRQYALNHGLIKAIAQGDGRQALTLVKAGADANTRFNQTSAPSLRELLKQLLRSSNLHDQDSHTAFALACGAAVVNGEVSYSPGQQQRPEDVRLVQVMLAHGANIEATGKDGWIPLQIAAVYNSSPDKMLLLLQRGANVNTQDQYGLTTLMRVVRFAVDANKVRLLLEHGANVNAQSIAGMTALGFAVRDGANRDIIQQLLAHGANPNLADPVETPLLLAQHTKRPDIVALLKHYGARR